VDTGPRCWRSAHSQMRRWTREPTLVGAYRSRPLLEQACVLVLNGFDGGFTLLSGGEPTFEFRLQRFPERGVGIPRVVGVHVTQHDVEQVCGHGIVALCP